MDEWTNIEFTFVITKKRLDGLTGCSSTKFYADTEARKAFDFGVDNRPKDGGDSKSKTTTTSGFTKENVLWNNQQVPITAEEKLGRRNQIIKRGIFE